MQPLAILGSGMVTGVGLTAPASCAAIRCAIDNFAETRFQDDEGEWIIGSQVQLEIPCRGLERLANMAVSAIQQCLVHADGARTESIALLLCVAEENRPGRLEGLNDKLFQMIENALGIRFHPGSGTIPRGHTAGGLAMIEAQRLIYEERVSYCVIAGTDSMLVRSSLDAYQDQQRLLTSYNSNGFIPGEAGCAVLVSSPRGGRRKELLCIGIGAGWEEASLDSEKPLRADGMVQAFNAAFGDANTLISEIDYRITDANGEQYWFKEAALAVTRTLRARKELFEIWHPVDCVGEVGAAIGPCVLSVALAAASKSYAPGAIVLCHFSEGSERLALILAEGN